MRYKLEGLDEEWNQRIDTMFVRVVFFNPQGDHVRTNSFPVSGRSTGWKGSVKNSTFTPRVQMLTVPPDAASMMINMTTAGPGSLVGIFTIKDMSVISVAKPEAAPKVLMSHNRIPGEKKIPWNKSGTHPSMASIDKSGAQDDSSPVLVIIDDDISAHADWMARIRIPPDITAGGTLEIRWKEAYSTGLGGDFTATYERLPAGKYRFVVEDLALTGEGASG